jgi:electron transport complex protein RnfC
VASYAFKGGVHIPNPYPIKKPEVKQVAPPEQAALFLQQRAGGKQKPCVKVGDKVLTGQVIAKTPGKYPSYTHASISGVVLAIENNAACSGGATCLTSGFFIGYGLGICTPPLKA